VSSHEELVAYYDHKKAIEEAQEFLKVTGDEEAFDAMIQSAISAYRNRMSDIRQRNRFHDMVKEYFRKQGRRA
jgi:hypothetical protein